MKQIVVFCLLCLAVPVYGAFLNTDVPTTIAMPGSAQEVEAGVWEIQGSGADIWGTTDEFHFLYEDQQVTDDFIAGAHIVSLSQPTNTWAKAGIMLRTGEPGSNPTASYAYVCVTTANGVCFQYRDGDGIGALDPFDQGNGLRWQTGPNEIHLRMVKDGTTIAGYASQDEATWQFLGSHTFTVADFSAAYRGIAVTSHDAAVLGTCTVDTIELDTEDFACGLEIFPSGFSCTVDESGLVNLSWVNNATYSDLRLLRDGIDLGIDPEDEMYQDDPGIGTYSYSLEGVIESEEQTCVAFPLTCTAVVREGDLATIDASGFFRTWLMLGPLAEVSDCATAYSDMVADYVVGTGSLPDGGSGPVSEATVLPKQGDIVEIDFGASEATSVMMPPNGQNPDAADGVAEWALFESLNEYVDHSTFYGDVDNYMGYEVCYLTNLTDSILLLYGGVSSDDSVAVMLDNSLYWANGVCRGAGNAGETQDSFPFILPPGDHRLIIKIFEEGGGCGTRFRLTDPATGLPLIGGDLIEVHMRPRAELVDDGVPPAPEATVTRTFPDVLFVEEEVTITLKVSGGPLTVYEQIPTNMEVIDLGGGAEIATGLIRWENVTDGDTLTYQVLPTETGGVFIGCGEQENGVCMATGGSASGFFPDKIEGWYSDDIADSGLEGSADITSIDDAFDMDIIASGSDIWGSADDFHFVWKNFPVDSMVIFEGNLVQFQMTTNEWAKAGFMFRTNLLQGSPFVNGIISAAASGGMPGATVQWRDTQNAAAAWDGANHPQVMLPKWIKLVYNRGLVTGYFADDLGGEPDDWIYSGEHTLNTEGVETVKGGVCVTSHDDAATINAVFEQVRLIQPCPPAKFTRFFAGSGTIDSEGETAGLYPEDADSVSVSIEISDVRSDEENGGDCPDTLGDITIVETVPFDWTAEDISDGGQFNAAAGTVTWSIPAAQFTETTLTYTAVGMIEGGLVVFAGEVQEVGNDFTFEIFGSTHLVSENGLGMDGAILSWLLLGPFGHNSPSTAQDAAIMALDHLTDGGAITEVSIMTEEALMQHAGDEIKPDFNGEAASTGLRSAPNPLINPNRDEGIAQWYAYNDLDGAQVNVNGSYLYGTNDAAMCYGLCYLDVQEPMTIGMNFGSDDAIEVLLDGEQIWINPVDRGWGGFVDQVTDIELDVGMHVLLVKIFNSAGGWNFGAQIVDEFGMGLPPGEGLKVTIGEPSGPSGVFVYTGDANGDNSVNLADAIGILTYYFSGGAEPPCMKAADVNDDDSVNLTDAVGILTYYFTEGTMSAPDGTGITGGTNEECAEFPIDTVEVLGCEVPCQ